MVNKKLWLSNVIILHKNKTMGTKVVSEHVNAPILVLEKKEQYYQLYKN